MRNFATPWPGLPGRETPPAMNTGKMPVPRYLRAVGVVALAIAITAAVEWQTGRNDFPEFSDPYTVIAENGIAPHPHLVSPCAYRFVTPMLAGSVARAMNVPTDDGFFWVNIVSSVVLLVMTYYLARRLGADVLGGLVALAVVGLSIGHLKNNMYFNNGMEAVTQIMMLGWCLAMFARQWLLATLCCCVGMCTREMFGIPAVLTLAQLGVLAWRARQPLGYARFALALAAIIASVVLPRALIEVSTTIQLIDPLYDSNWLLKLFKVPLKLKRDLNILLGTISYLLPTLMFLTRARALAAWNRLAPYRSAALLYCGTLTVLTMWGGTDLYRYITFLFIPQTFVLAALFANRDLRPQWGEALLVVVAVVWHNHTLGAIPNITDNLDVYLDFWPAFDNRMSFATAIRSGEIALSLGAVAGLRWYLNRAIMAAPQVLQLPEAKMIPAQKMSAA